MIRMEDVSLIYPNGVEALSGINLEIKKGEFIFIVGPTGCGKSSLLKLIYWEEMPSQGKVVVNGKDAGRLRAVQIPYLRRNIGVVFQDFKLLPKKTVWENVAFALEVTGASRATVYREVPRTLELVELSQKAKMYPDNLSWGEQQRVCVARALVNSPSILLADEPTGNLDPQASRKLVQLFLKVNRLGSTVVMATHNKNIVDPVRERVMGLKKGCLVSDMQKGQYPDEPEESEFLSS